jgi:hypothetical protein
MDDLEYYDYLSFEDQQKICTLENNPKYKNTLGDPGWEIFDLQRRRIADAFEEGQKHEKWLREKKQNVDIDPEDVIELTEIEKAIQKAKDQIALDKENKLKKIYEMEKKIHILDACKLNLNFKEITMESLGIKIINFNHIRYIRFYHINEKPYTMDILGEKCYVAGDGKLYNIIYENHDRVMKEAIIADQIHCWKNSLAVDAENALQRTLLMANPLLPLVVKVDRYISKLPLFTLLDKKCDTFIANDRDFQGIRFYHYIDCTHSKKYDLYAITVRSDDDKECSLYLSEFNKLYTLEYGCILVEAKYLGFQRFWEFC